eukprot:10348938-Alexandrium_andersonii.AAC.1
MTFRTKPVRLPLRPACLPAEDTSWQGNPPAFGLAPKRYSRAPPQGKLQTIGRVSMVVPGGVDHRNTPNATRNRRS